MGLGYRAFEAHWGPTAAIETDAILMMVDPRWELAAEERRYELAGRQCWLLARSFLAAGFGCVIIGGNGLHSPEQINELVTLLLGLGEVYHVTLDPSLSEIQRRVAERGGDRTPEWLAGQVGWMRGRYRSWSCRIDNTSLSPESVLAELAERTGRGEGRLTGPLPAL
jgi:hypothetical protein